MKRINTLLFFSMMLVLIIGCTQQKLSIETTPPPASLTPSPIAEQLQTTPEIDALTQSITTDIDTLTFDENTELEQILADVEEIETIDFG